MRKIKNLLSIIFCLALVSCGFTPMYKNSELRKVKIKEITYSGKNELIYFLRSNIDINQNAYLLKEFYNIKINVTDNVSNETKNNAGVITEENISIALSYEIFNENEKKIGQGSLSGNRVVSVTNDITNDEEVKRIEKENLLLNIIQELNYEIQSKILSQ